ncbi:MAG: alpha-mannosidase, partial [Candidatus Dormibacteria bacterium]
MVAHTHWDREWYAPFQVFRLRLVDALDELLDRLRSDPAWTSFLLDGQMAALDDYLELRPAAEEEVRALAGDGRLLLGPWYVLMDEFLVSGETILRNLEMGLRRAADFAGAMPVGYLPDMFGHIAQMPRLLRLAGLTEAVVWRGVPARIDRHTFTWSSPGGASVRAEYLPVGYSAGAALPLDADQLVARVEAYAAEVGALYPDPDQRILLMAGGDHQLPGAGLPASLDKANRAQEGVALELCSLPAYLAARPEGELPAWEGELRSGARANLLMGVASNRVDVKQAAARAERALERLAEPLAATWLPPERWP